MARAETLKPPIEPTDEEEPVTFDFWDSLGPTETITDILEISCTAIKGVDADEATRAKGEPAIAPSPRTGIDANAVVQQFGTMLDGVDYDLRCRALTSLGRKPVITVTLPCRAP